MKAARAVEVTPAAGAEVCAQSARMGDEFLTDRGAVALGELEFAALERIIERKDPSYRD